MNLPTHIHLENGDIYFTYDALGNKWDKFVDGDEGEKGTAYRFGFQYDFDYLGDVIYNEKLMFFPTAEGYVSAVYPDGITGGDPPKFAYVTNIRDHLGNLRMSITRDNNDKVILQERNYYPFGLLHKGYNEEKHEIKYTEQEEDKIFTPQVVAGHYKYWYQEQERQTDLDLNWDSFKYRNYDYAIGRFMNVDPLAEKYPYNSLYAFQENKLGLGRELEGLELLMLHGDIRGSLLFTASGSGGIYLDFKNNDIGVFGTVGFGAGLAAGASAGVGYTFYPTAGIEDVKGWGYSYVGSFTPGLKYSGSIERNIDLNEYKTTKTGFSINTGVGAEFVLAMEGTYTWATSGKPLSKIFYQMMEKADQDKIMEILDNNIKTHQNKILDLTKQYGNLEKMKADIKDDEKLEEINKQQIEIQNEMQLLAKMINNINEYKQYLNE